MFVTQRHLSHTPRRRATPGIHRMFWCGMMVGGYLVTASGYGAAMTTTGSAQVVSVEAAGAPQAYQFSVGIASPDKGCRQYADWWEVVTENGELVYRRILLHSHVGEQPFVRSGGPVAIGPDTVVWVRAHMHPGGYGGKVMKGTVRSGFRETTTHPDFAQALEKQSPQPDDCAF
jgi:hypothetical protein